MRMLAFSILGLAIQLGSVGGEPAMTAEDIEAAGFSADGFGEGADPLVARLQILLDRHGASPGVIDGYPGENLEEALRAFETMKGFEVDGILDETAWAALVEAGGPVTKAYTIVEDDLSGLVEAIPGDFSEMAKMERAGYTSVEEKLAERFHMDIDFLKEINPEADFSKQGTKIDVVDTGKDAEGEIARVEVTKDPGRLLALAADGSLVAAYPVTVGSAQVPSPSGTYEVKAIATDATYSYRPDENFRQGDNEEPLELPPGPNNPVGGIWIDLTEPTYGLHGTPDPSLVGKTQSHGCVRMTNWDARELASLVGEGTEVVFAGN